jgi:hypothetical protein
MDLAMLCVFAWRQINDNPESPVSKFVATIKNSFVNATRFIFVTIDTENVVPCHKTVANRD